MNAVKFICLISLIAFACSQDSFNKQFLPTSEVSNTSNTSTTSLNYPAINTTIHFVDSSLIDIVWCGEKRNVIFFLTEKNHLYRSLDEGFSGHILTEHLQELGKKELNGSQSEVIFRITTHV